MFVCRLGQLSVLDYLTEIECPARRLAGLGWRASYCPAGFVVRNGQGRLVSHRIVISRQDYHGLRTTPAWKGPADHIRCLGISQCLGSGNLTIHATLRIANDSTGSQRSPDEHQQEGEVG